MYAVIETGGKQYLVELGTELAVERLDGTSGTSIDFERVLLVVDGDTAQIGTPTVADARVAADVVRQDRGEKLIVFKYRPKARHRSKKGHRQEQTVIRIADIRFNGRSAAEEAGVQEAQDKSARKKAQAEAERRAAADQALAAKLATEAESKAAETEKASVPATKATTRKTPEKASADEPTKAAAKPTKAAVKPTKAAVKPTKAAAKPTTAKAKTVKADADAAEVKKPARTRSTRTSTKKDE